MSQPAANGLFRERRSSPRQRAGKPVMFLSNDCVLDEPFDGMLIDSSQGGVRLAVPLDDIAEGTTLMVRPTTAPVGTPWIPVLVKNRRSGQASPEVGCQFVRAVGPNTLRLFKAS